MRPLRGRAHGPQGARGHAGDVVGRKGRFRHERATEGGDDQSTNEEAVWSLNIDRRTVDLREACGRIAPVHPEYVNLAIQEGFDWGRLHDASFERLYLVVFRSVRRADADLDLLRERDDLAYGEALRSGGLLRYFKGEANERRECLSFCLWEGRLQAERAAGGASHSRAARIAAETYERYDLERYELTKGGDEEGSISFRRLGG